MKKLIYISVLSAFTLMACVPSRQYNDMVTDRDKYKAETELLNNAVEMKDKEIEGLNDQLEDAGDEITRLSRDLADLQNAYDRLERTNRELREIEDLLNTRIKEILALSTTENQQLNEELARREQELVDKEVALQEKEQVLIIKEAEIDALLADIEAKNARIEELETALNNLNEKLSAVKQSLEEALSGFSSSDLTITQDKGRIYINISEKLLFASGSTVVDARGKEALQQVAEVLKEQEGVSIKVEGHTDNVPLKSASFPKDNWDLSVLRATSIVKLLTVDYKMDPKNIEASGRGEYSPKASNEDATGRSRNRRTEIIIIPDLEEINNILEQLSQTE
jgi:chemotaxis protein MotB